MPKTKIIATLGPASESEEQIEALLKAGVSVFRFNTKHNTIAWHEEAIQRVKQVAFRLAMPIGILVDLPGPSLRIRTPNQKPLPTEPGEQLLLGTEFIPERKMIQVEDTHVIEKLSPGNRVLIDNGSIELSVIEKTDQGILLEANTEATIEDGKGMNVPSIHLHLASLITHDLERLDMAARVDADFIALSFIRSAKDVALVKKAMADRNLTAAVIGKIENGEALTHLDDIIDAADAIMVARGDLAIEIPFEELPYWQKTIVMKCRQKSKPVIIATQMLASMTKARRPTRAEVSDVATAIFDGADAMLLSNETAIGNYPALAVETMAKIATYNEEKALVEEVTITHPLSQTEAIAKAAISLLRAERDFTCSAVVIFTETSLTMRDFARYRPQKPIIALTRSEKVRNQLCLTYGAQPTLVGFPDGNIAAIDEIIPFLKEEKIVSPGERILFIHGYQWKVSGHTNTITIKEIV